LFLIIKLNFKLFIVKEKAQDGNKSSIKLITESTRQPLRKSSSSNGQEVFIREATSTKEEIT
jgi:hypothetical protein